MRVLGIDLGTRRIGVAVSDGTGLLAAPLSVIERSGDPARDRAAIVHLAGEEEVERVVVGLPTSLSGEEGPAAKAARDELVALSDELDVPVEGWDERFTTVIAHLAMGAGGKRSKERRKTIDAAAAAVMLQSWLDARRHQPAATDDSGLRG